MLRSGKCDNVGQYFMGAVWSHVLPIDAAELGHDSFVNFG